MRHAVAHGSTYSASSFDELGLAAADPLRGDTPLILNALSSTSATLAAAKTAQLEMIRAHRARGVTPRDRRLARAVEKLSTELEQSKRCARDLQKKLHAAEARLEHVAAELKQSRSSEQMAIAMLQEGWGCSG